MGIWSMVLLLLSASTLALIPGCSSQDSSCVTHLRQSLQDPTNSLSNWNQPNLKNPCNGSISNLEGAICNNGRVFMLTLNNLSLEGTISPFLSNCTNLQTLDLSSNHLTGPIPLELQSLVNLAVLNLSSNNLIGPIPAQLSQCYYLNIIDLHRNSLSGSIPWQLGFLVRLLAFNVSENQLCGPIPSSLWNRSGNLRRFNNTSSFERNKGLYGYPLGPLRSKGLSVLAIVGIGLGSGLVSLVVSFTAVCMWVRVTKRKMEIEEIKISQFKPDY